MTFVVQKSRNPMLNAAWAGFKKEQRGEKKADVHKAPAETAQIAPDVHKKAGKVHTKPPAKKASKKKVVRK